MPLLVPSLTPLVVRAREAQDDAEILRDHALSLAYRATMLRDESAALRAEAQQIRRRLHACRPPVA